MNYFLTSVGLWLSLFFFCNSASLQAQKCGQTTSTTVAVAETTPPNPRQLTPLPPRDQPLISEQTKIPSRQSKISQKRRQKFWKRQQRNRKKGCPAARF